MKKTRLLCVANKRLPDGDYRIQYRAKSSLANVVYALPGRPTCLQPHEFVECGFEEGLRFADLGSFIRFAKYLRQNRSEYDLVHLYSTKLQLFGAICAAAARIPCVATVTGYGRTFNRDELRYRLLRPLYLALMRLTLKLSKATFFQNHGDMQWLAEKFPSLSHKMHWIGSGVDAVVVGEKDFSCSPLKVLMVARLMPDKGIREFLQAAQQLGGEQYRFLLVGPRSIGQDSLYREVLESHERQSIEYHGELDQQSLQALYRECHVFAFPSHGEGMPRVMLEAGHALACPVASDIAAHRDLIENDRGFLLTPGRELESLVGHLKRLNADRSELERVARNYQRHIVEHYSIDSYVQRIDEQLQRLSTAA